MEININKQIKQKEDSLLFSTSLVFEQNIDKLWLFLRDLNNETKAIDFLDNLQYIKGENTWIQGNICTFNWIGLTTLQLKCTKSHVDRNKKVIKWKAKGDIGITYNRQIYLYRITQNNKTLVKVIVSQNEKENELVDYTANRNYYLNVEYNILKTESNYLKNLKEDIISYESCIINKNFINVWNFILDFKKMILISPIIAKNIEFNEEKIKEGVFFKFFLNNLNKTVFMRVKEIKTYKKLKSRWIKIETIGTNIDDLPKLVEYKIMILENNKTQLSISHIFHYNINKDYIGKLKIKKKEAIKKYKEYIEEQKSIEEGIINQNFDL